MEASKFLIRGFRLAALTPRVCECPSACSQFQFRVRLPIRQRPSSHKHFSATTRRRVPSVVESQSDGTTVRSAPPQAVPNPKQELQSYTNSLQKLIEGYKLENTLPARQHASLTAALNNAKSRLDARGAHHDSFAPLLKQLQGEVEPILQINLGSSNVTKLLADISQQKNTTPPQQPFEHEPKEPQTKINPEQESISQKLDAIMGARRQKPPVRTPPPPKKDDDDDDYGTMSTLDGLMAYYMKNPDAPDATTANRNSTARNISLAVQERLLGTDSAFRRSQRAKHAVNAPALRLKPSLGRTVEVRGNFDLTRAFRSLEGLCVRNSVRRDLQKQRFHVRRGMRKKTLRMERWRKMFKEGFLAECGKVRRMRKQGW